MVRLPHYLGVSVNRSPLRGAAPGTPTAMVKTPLDKGSSGVIVTLSAKSTCNTAPTTPKPSTTATCSTRFRAIHTNLPASPGLPRSSRQHTKLRASSDRFLGLCDRPLFTAAYWLRRDSVQSSLESRSIHVHHGNSLRVSTRAEIRIRTQSTPQN
jgi:hypothetical protein